MSRWSVAHRLAHIAAQGARGDAGWASDQRADVVGLIESNGVQGFGQHGKLFGAYLPAEPGRAPGVWLNAGLDVIAQRTPRHTSGGTTRSVATTDRGRDQRWGCGLGTSIVQPDKQ